MTSPALFHLGDTYPLDPRALLVCLARPRRLGTLATVSFTLFSTAVCPENHFSELHRRSGNLSNSRLTGPAGGTAADGDVEVHAGLGPEGGEVARGCG